MVQIQGNNTVSAAIPLYQKGFNWLKFWLGFCFATCLCIILAAAITFLTLYIIAQAGGFKTGRMMGAQLSAVVDNKPILDQFDFIGKYLPNSLSAIQELNDSTDFKYKYERLKSLQSSAA